MEMSIFQKVNLKIILIFLLKNKKLLINTDLKLNKNTNNKY